MKPIFAFLALAATLFAQRTVREVTNPAPTPDGDTKPNSDTVPDVFAITGKFARVVTLRVKYDTDLLAAMEKGVKQEHIQNAVILSAFGSVRGYQVHEVSNRTFPSKDTFVKDATAPADLIGMNGYIIGGRIHAHVTLATPEKAFGGHLEPGTRVFTFAVIAIGVMEDGLDFSKLDDKTYR